MSAEDWIPDFDREDFDGYEQADSAFATRETYCKHCKSHRVYWEKTFKGWLLCNTDGSKHACDQKDLQHSVKGLFEDLTK